MGLARALPLTWRSARVRTVKTVVSVMMRQSVYIGECEDMPRLLEHIDAIARKLQRDVLYLAFVRADSPNFEDYEGSRKSKAHSAVV